MNREGFSHAYAGHEGRSEGTSGFSDSRHKESSENSSEFFETLMAAERGETKDQVQKLLSEQDRLQDRISELRDKISDMKQERPINANAIKNTETEIKESLQALDNNAIELGTW
jgi:chromosome segregation ATPase